MKLVLTLTMLSLCKSFIIRPTTPFKPRQSSPLPILSTPISSSPSSLLMAGEMEEVHEKDLYPPPNPNLPSWRKGDLDGMDAPITEGWRTESENLIRLAGVQTSVEIVGLTWSFAKLQIVVPGKTSSEDQSRLVQEIHRVWEDEETPEDIIDVLEKHELIVCTPGAPNVLSTQEHFDAYVGFDVSLQTVDPFKSNRVIEGKLVSRDALEVKVNKKGRVVTVPNEMVGEVRLPKPKTEVGDPFN